LVGGTPSHLDGEFYNRCDLRLAQFLDRPVWVQQLEHACGGFLDSVLITAGHVAHVNPRVDVSLKVAPAKFSKDLCQQIKPFFIREQRPLGDEIIYVEASVLQGRELPHVERKLLALDVNGLLKANDKWRPKCSIPKKESRSTLLV